MADSRRYQQLLDRMGWTLCALAIVVVGARTYCRSVAVRTFTLDDCFMVMALAAGIVMMALLSAAVTHGYGLHVESIQNSYDREQALMYTFVAPTASILASTSGKMSMVLFLVRVLGQSTRKVHLWLLYSVTVIMIGANIFTMGVLLGGCTPMEKSWKPEISGSCVAPVVFKYVGRIQSGWNAFMDLTTAAFPLYMVWKLNLKRSTKFGLAFLTCGGVFAAAATFAKIWYMRAISHVTDITYAWAPISICYTAEVFVLIIAGSLPTLQPIMHAYCGRTQSTPGLFAIFKKDSSQGSSTSPYSGTTMAGTTGWELAEIENGNRKDSSSDLTALPPYPARPAVRISPPNSPVLDPDTSTPPQNRHSLGTITVQQDFSLSYERSPRDSMSLEDERRY